MTRCALLVSALALIVVAPGASARPRVVETRAGGAFWSTTAHELRLRGSVGVLAADGDRVAFSSCWWVGAVWQPRHDPHFLDGEPAADACNAYSSAGGFSSIAVAGDRVAYFRRSGGIGVLILVARADGGRLRTVVAHSNSGLPAWRPSTPLPTARRPPCPRR
jgi:hypothetical protein